MTVAKTDIDSLDPNPYPPTSAASETFIQTAGTITTVIISTVVGSTQTVTRTVTQPAWTDTSTLVQGGTTTIVHPSSTLLLTSVSVATSTAVTTVANRHHRGYTYACDHNVCYNRRGCSHTST